MATIFPIGEDTELGLQVYSAPYDFLKTPAMVMFLRPKRTPYTPSRC